MPNSMPDSVWNDNGIQFPRLIAEISANVNISEKDWLDLCASMDLTDAELNELFDRADVAWNTIKAKV